MKRKTLALCTLIAAIVLLAVFLVLWGYIPGCIPQRVTETHEEITDAKDPYESFLADDNLADKNPPFIEDLVVEDRWHEKINRSAAVIGLDVVGVRDDETWMNDLMPTYADAVKAAREHGKQILPSVNLINGKAKQFDDGLYAAMDLAYFHGVDASVPSFPDMMRRFYEAVKANPKSAAFFSAGLSIAKIDVAPVDADAKRKFLADFENDEVASKPTGFYTWSDELKTLFRFFRFFQQRLNEDHNDREIADCVAGALLKDAALRKDYEALLAFYAGLTNPYIALSCADLIDGNNVSQKSLEELTEAKGLPARPNGPAVCVLPYSTSTETVLFEKLFPEGLPANVNLMKELITRIRSGEVDLAPRKDSGWYDRQVYALETLLLPEKGAEAQKLFLTAKYKKRLLEAFKAIITVRRETHIRMPAVTTAKAEPRVSFPELRLEPAPTFYLRTARAYSFLETLLTALLGADALHSLHRIKENGRSEMLLDEELRYMKTLFYGFYLVSCDDIGMKPDLSADALENPDAAMKAAVEWLNSFETDGDLALDTRVSVPIFIDLVGGVTRLWATLGVRLVNLEASYKKPPSVRVYREGGKEEWMVVDALELSPLTYTIAVAEFSEITLPRLGALTREELRAVCDREKTKEKILAALQK